jgi:hypothetical protein
VREPHAGLHFIAMLPAGAARDKKLHLAIALQCVTVCSISGHKRHQNHFLICEGAWWMILDSAGRR